MISQFLLMNKPLYIKIICRQFVINGSTGFDRRKAEGRGQKELLPMHDPSGDREGARVSRTRTIKDLVAPDWEGFESPSKFFPSAFCLLPSAFFNEERQL